MRDNFLQLQIDQSFIGRFAFKTSTTFALNIFRGPSKKTDRQVVEEFRLEFTGVKRLRLELDANPWLEIKSHRILTKSDFLCDYAGASSSAVDQSEVHHFEI